MKIALTLLFILSFSFSFAQVDRDKVLNKTVTSLSEMERTRFDTSRCLEVMDRAYALAKNDSIYISPYFLKTTSRTYREILHREYKIIFGYNHIDDVIRSEMKCFERYMQAYAEYKYGANFFERTKRKADSLDRAGVGYKSAKETNGDVRVFLKKEYKYSELFSSSKDTLYAISFQISEKGKVENIKMYKGVKNVSAHLFTLETTHPYMKEITALLAKTKWTPATLYGKEVREELQLLWSSEYLDFTWE